MKKAIGIGLCFMLIIILCACETAKYEESTEEMDVDLDCSSSIVSDIQPSIDTLADRRVPDSTLRRIILTFNGDEVTAQKGEICFYYALEQTDIKKTSFVNLIYKMASDKVIRADFKAGSAASMGDVPPEISSGFTNQKLETLFEMFDQDEKYIAAISGITPYLQIILDDKMTVLLSDESAKDTILFSREFSSEQ